MKPLATVSATAILFLGCFANGDGATDCLAGAPESGWTWRQLESSPPLNDFESGTAFDLDADRLVLWGGHNNFGGPQRAETWLFDPEAETWELVEPANRPVSACCVRDMVYDPANKATYFLGAHHYSHGWMWRAPQTRAAGYPWAYDAQANTWRCMKPLVHSSSPWTGGIYHPEHQVVLTYGGQYISERNVWAYDGYANTWTEIAREGDGPGVAGMLAPLAYDSDRGMVLYYDGGRGEGERASLWQYDLAANNWEQLGGDGGEKPRRSHNLFVYDHLNRLPILFAAADDKLAAYGFDRDAKQWKKLAVEGDPPPGYSIQQGAYDPKRHRTIFANGGIYNVRNQRAVYVFQHAKPEHQPAAKQPAPADVKATTTSQGQVEVTFRPAEGATRHEVHRGAGEHPWQVTFEKLGYAESGKFVDPKPAKDGVNFYMVKALWGDGREATSLSLKVRAQPRVPGQPVVSVLDEKRIEIVWPKNAETDVAGYHVYEVAGGRQGRGNRGTPSLKKLNDAPLSEATFTLALDELPAEGDGGSRYVVRAVNRLGVESGNSPWADTFASEPNGVLAKTVEGKPVVTWKANPEKGIAGYDVYRLDGGNSAKKIAGRLAETRFVDETGTGSGRCKYYIVPIDALGREGRASYGAWLDGGFN